LVPKIEALRTLSQEPSFATLSPPLQLHVLHDLHELQSEFARLIEPIYEAWQRAEADPLVRLQERDRPPVRSRGRPSSVLATAFMAVMNHHLRLRGSQGHARVVGEVTYALFPRAFMSHPRHPSGWSPADVGPDAPLIGIEDKVRDRLRKFGYAVEEIVAAISREMSPHA
jgi:hypothetical protein